MKGKTRRLIQKASYGIGFAFRQGDIKKLQVRNEAKAELQRRAASGKDPTAKSFIQGCRS